MWAVNWCFCHNGHVPLFIDHPEYVLGSTRNNNHNNDNPRHRDEQSSISRHSSRFYYPVGDTDSEATFCAMLNALRCQFHTTMPSLPVLYEEIQLLCNEIVQYNPSETIFNFLLTCGPHVLWVYSWPGKRPNSNVWNGLHYVVKNQSVNVTDEDINIKVSVKQKARKNNMTNYHDYNNNICIVATKPFTNDDDWIELQRGELIVLDEGIPHVTPTDLFRIELHGHGINNEKQILSPPKLQEDMRRYSIHPDFFIGGGI
jgi:predicted glutamine amidotransferase